MRAYFRNNSSRASNYSPVPLFLMTVWQSNSLPRTVWRAEVGIEAVLVVPNFWLKGRTHAPWNAHFHSQSTSIGSHVRYVICVDICFSPYCALQCRHRQADLCPFSLGIVWPPSENNPATISHTGFGFGITLATTCQPCIGISLFQQLQHDSRLHFVKASFLIFCLIILSIIFDSFDCFITNIRHFSEKSNWFGDF